MKRTLTMARLKPGQIQDPDCSGHLCKYSHKRDGGVHWKPIYFVLKDTCLYLYRSQDSETVAQASAVVYLHGYRVRSKQVENKKHTFELVPPAKKTMRPLFLMADTDMDKRR